MAFSPAAIAIRQRARAPTSLKKHLSWDEAPFKVTAPNITQDEETGIGNYADAELKQVLRKGIKRNGMPVAMIMPSGFYEIMTDHDRS